MRRDEHDRIVVIHGPDPKNWPEQEQNAWQAFETDNPEQAAFVSKQERAFTQSLHRAVQTPSQPALATRLAAAVMARRKEAVSIRQLLIGGGLTTIASTLAGVMLALMLDASMLDYPLEGDVATTLLIEPNLIWTEE